MSRLPRPLARRLDRLAWRAHLFHRYAHHPLCAEYQGELIPLGHRARLCRGCTYVLLGTLGGLALGLLLSLPPLALLGLSLATWLGTFWRGSKLRTRFLPAFALALATTGGTWWTALIAVTLFAATWRLYRRRQPDRTPCRSCPEATRPTPCRGVQPIVRRERAYQRRVQRILDGAGL